MANETTTAQPREMTGAEMVLTALADHGVEHLFGYPGGAVLPIYDEIFKQDKVQHILVRHEQGAAHAAEGCAARPARSACAAGDVRPRRDQCRHRAYRRADGLDPAGLHHRPGRHPSDRQRCLPGMRHRWHHAPLHQAQLAGRATSRTLPQVLHEAFYVASHWPSGPGGRRHPEGHRSSPSGIVASARRMSSTRPTSRSVGDRGQPDQGSGRR